MDFSLLKTFVAVADEKSFSTAAKHLFVSQQSLSKQIAKLEDELGSTLFIRSRPLDLTPDGKLFLQTAREILHLKQQYEENSSKSLGEAHYIHVGIEHTIARAVLPRILPSFIAAHPDAYLRINEDSPEVLEKSVSFEGVDLVIGSINNTPDNFETIPLCRKKQLLVVPKKILKELAGDNYPLVRADFSDGADLSYFESAPFIKIPRLSSGGRALNSYLKYYDINPHFVCELTNVENAFQLANSGVGCFVYAKIFWDMLSPELQMDYFRNVDIFPLPDLPELDSVCAYYHKDAEPVGLTKELLETFRRFFDEYSKGELHE